MNIADLRNKCKARIEMVPKDVLVVAILICVSVASFGLGYLAGADSAEQGTGISVAPVPTPDEGAAGTFIASKNGTKYYPPSCASASRITDANKIWFASADAAQAAGYTPATNCSF